VKLLRPKNPFSRKQRLPKRKEWSWLKVKKFYKRERKKFVTLEVSGYLHCPQFLKNDIWNMKRVWELWNERKIQISSKERKCKVWFIAISNLHPYKYTNYTKYLSNNPIKLLSFTAQEKRIISLCQLRNTNRLLHLLFLLNCQLLHRLLFLFIKTFSCYNLFSTKKIKPKSVLATFYTLMQIRESL